MSLASIYIGVLEDLYEILIDVLIFLVKIINVFNYYNLDTRFMYV